MNEKVGRRSDKKTERTTQLKQENIKPPNLDESKDREPVVNDYVSHLFSYVAAGGAGSAAPPGENISSLLNGSLMTHPANQTPRQHTVAQLQQTLGNRYVQRMMDKSNAGINKPDLCIQAKLTIGQPDDIYEKEADRIAEQVMRMPETNPLTVQRKPTCTACVKEEEKELIQTKPVKNRLPETSSVPRIPSLSGGGQPLPGPVRSDFENRFGQDFSGVRIHSGSKAAEDAGALNARAFTTGKDVVFGSGEYSPYTTEGKRLLAHELTHVVQQSFRSSAPRLQRRPCPESCRRTAAEAAEYVDSHVIPRNCFVWYTARDLCPKSCGNRRWKPISGTGCAHWVAHHKGIKVGKPWDKCTEGYSFRIKDVVGGKSKRPLEEAEIGDMWVSDNEKHMGLVVRINRKLEWKLVDISKHITLNDIPIVNTILRVFFPFIQLNRTLFDLLGIPIIIPVPVLKFDSISVQEDSSEMGGVVTRLYRNGTIRK